MKKIVQLIKNLSPTSTDPATNTTKANFIARKAHFIGDCSLADLAPLY
jgi:hypothetical protein